MNHPPLKDAAIRSTRKRGYQKSFKDENFVQRKNRGELDQFLDSDHHEGIISREDFENAQEALKQRAKEVGYREGTANNRGNQRYPFTGILICKACGSVMHRQTWNGDRPCWICHKHTSQPDLCSMKPQSEADLKRAFINCLNKLAWSQRKGYGILDITWRCRRRAYTKQSLTKEVEAACPCRIVRERDVKAAIIKAFNSLAWRRDELVRMQGAIWDGEIKRIDEQVEAIQEQQKRLGERLDNVVLNEAENDDSSVDVHSGEAEFLKSELDRLEMEYTRLILERAEAANREIQIRILLELVDAMRREAGAKLPTDTRSSFSYENGVDNHNADDAAACYDYEEFFRRTSYIDSGIIGDDGKIMCCSNDLIIRYLEKVVVNEDGYEVWFKAGVSVKIPLEKLNK